MITKIEQILNDALNQAICLDRIKADSNSIAKFVIKFVAEKNIIKELVQEPESKPKRYLLVSFENNKENEIVKTDIKRMSPIEVIGICEHLKAESLKQIDQYEKSEPL